MTYPSSDVSDTNLDNGATDSPQLARAQLLDLVRKFNELRNHISVFVRGLLTSSDAAAARSTLVAAQSGTNSDITTTTALGTFNYGPNEQLRFDNTVVNAAFAGTSFGAPGVSLNPNRNLCFAEGSGLSIATIFRQASNASLIMGSGVRLTTTPNGFASATSNSWPHAAVEVGYYGIKFYHNALSTVAPGTDITMSEQVRFVNGGLQYSTIPGYTGLYNQYQCRAWVNFNGTGSVAIRASGNISSVTDNGTGDYTVNFAVAMPDANYCPVLSSLSLALGDTRRVISIAGAEASGPTTMTVSSLRINVGNAASVSLIDNATVCVAIFR